MKVKKSSKWMLATMSAFTLALAGCGADGAEEQDNAAAAADGEEITIRVAWWGNQERHDRTLEAIELFEEENPHIRVESEFTGWDGYWQRLSTQAAGNDLPDVIQMDFSRLNEYSDNDLIIDLTPFIEDGTINLDNVDEIYQQDLMDGDTVLGVSLGANAQALVYNRTFMEELGLSFEPGDTYEDLKALLLEVKEIQEAQGETFFGFDFGRSEYDMFITFARQHGQTVFNEEGTGVGFERQTLVDYFAWIQDMVNEGTAPSHDIVMSYMDGGQEMIHDRSALLRMAASNQVIAISEGTNDELGLTILPLQNDGLDGNWIRASQSFSISSHSEHQEAAAVLIDFFTNSIEANEILRAERGVPISSEVREHLASMLTGPVRETFDFLEIVAEYTDPADPLPPAGLGEVRSAFDRLVEAITFDTITPEEAADQFMEEAVDILN